MQIFVCCHTQHSYIACKNNYFVFSTITPKCVCVYIILDLYISALG